MIKCSRTEQQLAIRFIMDMNIGTIASLFAIGVGVFTLCAFLIKALIYKTSAPLTLRVTNLEKEVLSLTDSHETLIDGNKTIIGLLEIIKRDNASIPGQIDEKIIAREQDRQEFVDLKYATKKDLDKKQDKK